MRAICSLNDSLLAASFTSLAILLQNVCENAPSKVAGRIPYAIGNSKFCGYPRISNPVLLLVSTRAGTAASDPGTLISNLSAPLLVLLELEPPLAVAPPCAGWVVMLEPPALGLPAASGASLWGAVGTTAPPALGALLVLEEPPVAAMTEALPSTSKSSASLATQPAKMPQAIPRNVERRIPLLQMLSVMFLLLEPVESIRILGNAFFMRFLVVRYLFSQCINSIFRESMAEERYTFHHGTQFEPFGLAHFAIVEPLDRFPVS